METTPYGEMASLDDERWWTGVHLRPYKTLNSICSSGVQEAEEKLHEVQYLRAEMIKDTVIS